VFVAVADTHAVLWYLAGDSRLSARANQFIRTAENEENHIGISSISMVEMVYLVERGRISPQEYSLVGCVLDDPESIFVEVPVDLRIARALSRVDVKQISDMPDRIVAATAVFLEVPIISRDGKIKLSTLNTIW
jgi:PIN domain nuclease of toxin-antitoxin system